MSCLSVYQNIWIQKNKYSDIWFFLSDRSTSKKIVGEVFFSVSMGKGVIRGETRCGGNDTSFPAALPRSLAQSKCRLDFF